MPNLRLGAAATIAAVVLLCPASVEARQCVQWDCALTTGPVDCPALAGALFSSLELLESAGEECALEAKVRATPVASATRYTIAFERADVAEAVALKEVVPLALSRDEVLIRLVAALHRGSAPFLSARGPATRTAEGRYVLPLAAAGEADTANVDPDAGASSTGWFVSPSLAGEIVHAGVSIVAATGALRVNHSTLDHRARLDGELRYQHLRLDLPGGDVLEGDVVRGGAGLVLAHRIEGGMSGAVLGGIERAPQNNLALTARGGIGIEWLSAPFVEPGDQSAGVRYQVGVEHQRYATQNLEQRRSSTLPVHGLGFVIGHHERSFDLSVEAGVDAPIARPEFVRVAGEAGIDLHLGAGFEVGLSGHLSFRDRALHAPADPDQLDPVAQLVGGNDWGTLTYGSELELSYTIGDSLLEARDRRWD